MTTKMIMTIMMINIISNHSMIVNHDYNDTIAMNHDYTYKCRLNFDPMTVGNIIIISLQINAETENNHNKTKQTKHNKTNHIKNGNQNKKNKNQTKIKCLKLMQINKGSSNLAKHVELIKKAIFDTNPSIVIIPESQIKINEVHLNVHFSNYHVENHNNHNKYINVMEGYIQ